MPNAPTASDGVADLVIPNWGIECSYTLEDDVVKTYNTPDTDDEYPWANGIFVEAPWPPNSPYGMRLGTDVTADHLLCDSVSTAGLIEQILNLPDRQRVVTAGDPCRLLYVNGQRGRLWLRLMATGSDTGAISSSTPINTPLSINSVGRICIRQAGQSIRAYLKRNHIGAAYGTSKRGMIMVEMAPKPEPHNLT